MSCGGGSIPISSRTTRRAARRQRCERSVFATVRQSDEPRDREEAGGETLVVVSEVGSSRDGARSERRSYERGPLYETRNETNPDGFRTLYETNDSGCITRAVSYTRRLLHDKKASPSSVPRVRVAPLTSANCPGPRRFFSSSRRRRGTCFATTRSYSCTRRTTAPSSRTPC